MYLYEIIAWQSVTDRRSKMFFFLNVHQSRLGIYRAHYRKSNGLSICTGKIPQSWSPPECSINNITNKAHTKYNKTVGPL